MVSSPENDTNVTADYYGISEDQNTLHASCPCWPASRSLHGYGSRPFLRLSLLSISLVSFTEPSIGIMRFQPSPLLLSLSVVSAGVVPGGGRSGASNSAQLLALHKSLCDIPSVTASEASIGDWLAAYLESHSFTVEKHPADPADLHRNNIFAYLGHTRSTTTLLTSHLDTVAPHIPYTRHPNGTISGRGTNDAKGCIAAQITAVQELLLAGAIHEGDVALLYVVGEEVDGAGMVAANNLGLAWTAVVFGEPTENKLSLGHKGALVFTISAHGKAAHSGYPQLGVDANQHLVQALYALDGLTLPGSQLLGESTLNYGVIAGGVAANVVSGFASASVAVRLAVEGESVRSMVDAAMREHQVELVYSERGFEPQLLDHDVDGGKPPTALYHG